jgi:RNA polymerase sigma factor (sigma-70 family)
MHSVMELNFEERGRWLAKHILPLEPLLRSLLRRAPLDGLEVDDIIQETYARIVSQPALSAIRYPKQYAIQTANSVVIDHIRHNRVVSITFMGELEQLDIAASGEGVDRVCEFREEIGQIVKLLASLHPTTRETLICRRVEGLSQIETARKLGVSVKTVEKHMALGVLKLMDTFGRGGKSRLRSSKQMQNDIARDYDGQITS